MPIYEHRCPEGHITENLYKNRPEIVSCRCGKDAKIIPSLFARTPGLFGDCSMGGVNGHYDASLGASYKNSMERDALMKAKGVVHLDDVGGDSAIDDHFNRQRAKEKESTDYMNKYNSVLKETHDPVTAMSVAQESK